VGSEIVSSPTLGGECEQLFQRCIVKIQVGESKGTGFFISDSLIVTCQHVVGDTNGTEISIQSFYGDFSASRVVRPDLAALDLALLQFDPALAHQHISLPIDADVSAGEWCYAFGYSDLRPDGDPVILQVDGKIGSVIKLRSGQVRPGHSGSPVLNLRTGKVVGLLRITRDRALDLGGIARSLDSLRSDPATAIAQPASNGWTQLWARSTEPRPSWFKRYTRSHGKLEPFSPSWFLFSEQKIALYGRDGELQTISEFLYSGAMFSWWAMYGRAGVGKSRIAQEMMEHAGALWQCGFLDLRRVTDVETFISRSQRQQIIVVDYASRDPNQLKNLLLTCAGIADGLQHRLRVLLIDRDLSDSADVWLRVLPPGAVDTAHILGYRHSTSLPIEGVDEQIRDIFKAWLEAGAPERVADLTKLKPSFWKQLREETGGRPLLLGVAAAAFAKDRKIRIKSLETPLSALLTREFRRWQEALRDGDYFDDAVALIAIATLLRGLPLPQRDDQIIVVMRSEDKEDNVFMLTGPDGQQSLPSFADLHLLPESVRNRVDLATLRDMVFVALKEILPENAVSKLIATCRELCPPRWALEPDLFGELFLDRYWAKPILMQPDRMLPVLEDHALERLMLAAWHIRPLSVISTLDELRLTTTDPDAFVRALSALVLAVTKSQTVSDYLDQLAVTVYNSLIRIAQEKTSAHLIVALMSALKALHQRYPDNGDIAYRYLKGLISQSKTSDFEQVVLLRKEFAELAVKLIGQIQARSQDRVDLHWGDTVVVLILAGAQTGDRTILELSFASARELRRTFGNAPDVVELLCNAYFKAAMHFGGMDQKDHIASQIAQTLASEFGAGLADEVDFLLRDQRPVDIPQNTRTRLVQTLVNLNRAASLRGDDTELVRTAQWVNEHIERVENRIDSSQIRMNVLYNRTVVALAKRDFTEARALLKSARALYSQGVNAITASTYLSIVSKDFELADDLVTAAHLQEIVHTVPRMPEESGLLQLLIRLITLSANRVWATEEWTTIARAYEELAFIASGKEATSIAAACALNGLTALLIRNSVFSESEALKHAEDVIARKLDVASVAEEFCNFVAYYAFKHRDTYSVNIGKFATVKFDHNRSEENGVIPVEVKLRAGSAVKYVTTLKLVSLDLKSTENAADHWNVRFVDK
jgi:hypothetical protein